MRPPTQIVPEGMGPYARRNFRLEFAAAFFLPFLLAPAEGAIAGSIARVWFEGNLLRPLLPIATADPYASMVFDAIDLRLSTPILNFAVAIITAAPAFANVLNFVWVRLSHGSHKIRFIIGLQTAMMLTICAIAALPRSLFGLVGLLVLIAFARFLWSGNTTLRSTVWGRNYPREVRGRATGRFMMVNVTLIALLGWMLGTFMEWNPSIFRVLLPVGGLLGAVGIVLWSRIRVRGHRGLRRRERQQTDRPSFNPVQMVHILREDRRFGFYMGCMFLLGLGNLMIMPIFVIVLREQFGFSYKGNIQFASSIPLICMLATIPFWARFLERTHIIGYRAVHAWFFIAATLAFLIAGVSRTEWMLWVASILQGTAFGGGVLAWTLGHLDFAPPDKASQYMGIHVTLTGVRGCIAPFIGVGLYEVLKTWDLGPWVFVACLAINTMGAIGFVIMARREGPGMISTHKGVQPQRVEGGRL
ncbi:MAG: MFS transporter [Phycisphaerales bacterium]|nr:MFS transporter [Phycisphaerales bacterium]